MSRRPVLDVRGLAIGAGRPGRERPLVAGIDLRVEREEIVALVGESGSGKSLTALSSIGLLPDGVRVTGGSIELEGREVSAFDERRWRTVRGRAAGMVFQEPLSSLNPVLTIGDQLREAVAYAAGVRGARARATALELLAAVGFASPATTAASYPHQLSGGQRQRVVLAGALAGDPALLIADEPTTALDSTVALGVLDLIRDSTRRLGSAVLLITHDLGVVAHVADRVYVMRAGEIVESGPACEILARPAAPYTRALVEAIPLLPARGAAVVTERPEAPASAPSSPGGGAEPEPLLRLSGVTKQFTTRSPTRLFRREHVLAVDDVSLELAQDGALGIVGESGSGKSTLAKLITGIHRADAGSIRFAGEDITRGGFRNDIQLVFQDPYGSLNPRLTVGRIIGEPLRNAGTADIGARTRDLLDAVDLSRSFVDRYPHQLSGGQRQRVAIARAISTRPRLLVLDEPVSALDVTVQARILDLLARLRPEFGLSYIFIAHGLGAVYRIADHVAVMYRSRLVEYGEVDDVFRAPGADHTRALLEATLTAA